MNLFKLNSKNKKEINIENSSNENKKSELEVDANEGISYEASIKYLIEQSNRRAWLVAIISVVITFLSILTLILLIPLKTTEPYVVRVDNNTGVTDIVTIVGEQEIGDIEALDKFFASQYVKKREGYYYDLLAQDYQVVQLMSSEKIADEYRALYGRNGRDTKFKDEVEVEVKIISVVLGNSNNTKTATLRTLIIENNLKTGNKTESAKVITLSYEYDYKKALKEENRLLNPLGYQVLTYRIDSEIRNVK